MSYLSPHLRSQIGIGLKFLEMNYMQLVGITYQNLARGLPMVLQWGAMELFHFTMIL